MQRFATFLRGHGPLLVMLGLMLLVALSRLVQHPANFTPVGALALFAGAYLADRRLAVLSVLGAMALSDLFLGLHALLPLIYLCIAACVLLAFPLRRRLTLLRAVGAGVGGGLLFYLVTHVALWLSGGSEFCRAGFAPCLEAGLPFFRNWMAGTAIYGSLMFGVWYLLRLRFPQLARATA